MKMARDGGNPPFGALLADAFGRILLEQGNLEFTEKICTGHAETMLMGEIADGRAIVAFSHTGSGLAVKGDRLKGFKISGLFVDAEAVLKGDRVVVYSDKVKEPVAVRYAYEGFPEASLYNKEGLPASPFRTDGSE